jgi:hypothetical protein
VRDKCEGDRQMRRLIRLVMVLGLVAAGLFSGVRAAGAAAPCPGDPYPVGVGATISASTTTPYVGQTIKVGGRNFGADEDVVISIGGTRVATAHTDVMGSFDPQVVVPGPAGDQELSGVGASGSACDADSLTLHVRVGAAVEPIAVGPRGGGSGIGAGSGGLAFTGVQIAAMVAAAAVLLGVGAFLVTAGRRRRTTHG